MACLVRRRAAAGSRVSAPRYAERPDPAHSLAGLRAGDTQAIAELRGLIHQQLRWIDGPEERDWCEDITQEVLFSLLRSRPPGDLPDSAAAYLRTAVQGAYIDRLRKEHGRRRTRSDGQPLGWRRSVSWECCGDPRAAVPSLLDNLLHEGIGEALSGLGAPERRAVVFKYILGLSDGEAVSLLGGSCSTYRRTVKRGVEAMRHTLIEPRGDPHEGWSESWPDRKCA